MPSGDTMDRLAIKRQRQIDRLIKRYLPTGNARQAAIKRTGGQPPAVSDLFTRYQNDPVAYCQRSSKLTHYQAGCLVGWRPGYR